MFGVELKADELQGLRLTEASIKLWADEISPGMNYAMTRLRIKRRKEEVVQIIPEGIWHVPYIEYAGLMNCEGSTVKFTAKVFPEREVSVMSHISVDLSVQLPWTTKLGFRPAGIHLEVTGQRPLSIHHRWQLWHRIRGSSYKERLQTERETFAHLASFAKAA